MSKGYSSHETARAGQIDRRSAIDATLLCMAASLSFDKLPSGLTKPSKDQRTNGFFTASVPEVQCPPKQGTSSPGGGLLHEWKGSAERVDDTFAGH